MQSICPECQRELKTHKERRFIDGNLQRKRFAVAYSALYRFECSGRRGCGANHLVRLDKPADTTLQSRSSLYHNWAVWKKAKKNRPGISNFESNASKFTKLVKRDTADVYEAVLEHVGINPPKKRRVA
jgi:hypothetical protein